MGLDFIRQLAGNFKKTWNHGTRRLAAPDLFTSHPECGTRSIVADLIEEPSQRQAIKPAEKLVLQCEEGGFSFYRDNIKVATRTKPPADLFAAVFDCGGYALVKVDKINKRSGTLSLSIKE